MRFRDAVLAIDHRGDPRFRNEFAKFADGKVLLAANRLPIVSEIAERQPVISPEGDAALIHNGEIYDGGKRPAAGKSDTIRLLDSIRQIGVVAALENLDWEGALVFVDIAHSEAYLARDHLGIKPIYYSAEPTQMCAASEIKALVAAGCKEVLQVPPGGIIKFSIGGYVLHSEQISVTKFVRTSYRAPDLADIERKIARAVRDRTPAEPYGILLSGGLDSSLVLSYAHEINRRVTAFLLERPDSPDSKCATRLCAEREIVLVRVPAPSVEELRRLAPYTIETVESWEWHVINHAAPMNPLMDAIKDTGIRVVLTGEGADEVFFGYEEELTPGTSQDDDCLENRRLQRLGFLHRTNCQRIDRMTMSRTIECRVPFLARDVVGAALQIRPSDHRSNGATKSILRRIASARLPRYIVEREKLSLAKGVGYNYGRGTEGGVFEGESIPVAAQLLNSSSEMYQTRYPIEASMVYEFERLGYAAAGFMKARSI